VLVHWDKFPLCHTPMRSLLTFYDQISILIVDCATIWSRDSHHSPIRYCTSNPKSFLRNVFSSPHIPHNALSNLIYFLSSTLSSPPSSDNMLSSPIYFVLNVVSSSHSSDSVLSSSVYFLLVRFVALAYWIKRFLALSIFFWESFLGITIRLCAF